MSDNINHPKHYLSRDINCTKCGTQVECIDVTSHFGFHLGNVIKYVWRHESKNGIEDLKKAQWYLNDYIKRMQKGE